MPLSFSFFVLDKKHLRDKLAKNCHQSLYKEIKLIATFVYNWRLDKKR
jgi:hypothetical protein